MIRCTLWNHISARCLSNTELLRCYLVPDNLIPENIASTHYTNWLDGTMQFGLQCHLRSTVLSQLVELAGFADEMLYDESESSDTYQYYAMTASP